MIVINGYCDHDGIQRVETVPCTLYTGESGAHQFVIRGKDGATLYALSGTVSAKFTPSRGNTIALTGSISDGAACVTLSAACYATPGAFVLHIYLSADGATTCIYSGRGTVMRAQTDEEADGGTVISDLTALFTAAGSLDTRVTALENAEAGMSFDAMVRMLDGGETAGAWYFDYDETNDVTVDTVTLNGLTAHRDETGISVTGTATAATYIFLNGNGLQAETGAMGQSWGQNIWACTSIAPAYVIWEAEDTTPAGVQLVYSDALDDFEATLTEYSAMDLLKLSQYPGETCPLALVIPNGTVMPTGWKIRVEIVGELPAATIPQNIKDGTGTGSVVENSLSGNYANTASGNFSHAEGVATTASGQWSHAEGNRTTASGEFAHAEGDETIASGSGSHAEGCEAEATGNNAHAEGTGTTASGNDAHAEGYLTTASGTTAHAEGNGTVANHKAQHVFGEYNAADSSTAGSHQRGTYVEIVGNGTSNSARSNARTLDWSGNETLAGNLTLGAGTASEVTITAAQLTQLLALLN